MDELTRFPNWGIYGHDWAVDFLRKGLLYQRTRHAYLFVGADNIGKNSLAHAFAMTLNCGADDPDLRPCGVCRSCKRVKSGNHPDLLYSDNDEKSGQLKIDAIRDVMRLLALKPFDSRYRIGLFLDFDHAQARAQDALLKTLEEPAPHALLFLVAESMDGIMPTIASRCQVIHLRPVPLQQVEQVLLAHDCPPEQAQLIARLSAGRLGWALSALNNADALNLRLEHLEALRRILSQTRRQRFDVAEDIAKLANKDKPAVRLILEAWQSYWRDILMLIHQRPDGVCNIDKQAELKQVAQQISPEVAYQALKATRKILGETLYTNANARLVFETLCLDYPRVQLN
jgi:DNA polymerase-3 subunit delta'